MSAADLFKDRFDVEFRLRKTYIIVGKIPLLVKEVESDGGLSGSLDHTALLLQEITGKYHRVPITKLPLSSMTKCPWGYYQGSWWAKGPARHRFQGILSSSFWRVLSDGTIDPCGVYDIAECLKTLLIQPKYRPLNKRPHGILTRDVAIGSNSKAVIIRGRVVGDYIGANKMVATIPLTDTMQELIENARLTCVEMETAE